LNGSDSGDLLLHAAFPSGVPYKSSLDSSSESFVSFFLELVHGIRHVLQSHAGVCRKSVRVSVDIPDASLRARVESELVVLRSVTRCEGIFLEQASGQVIDLEGARLGIQSAQPMIVQSSRNSALLARVSHLESKLSNVAFVSRAPSSVVSQVREELRAALEKLRV
jgi:valyl-tRNA synthetase